MLNEIAKRKAGQPPRLARDGEGIVMVNFASGDGKIGCSFGCAYCIWELSPNRADWISPPPDALEAFIGEYATRLLSVNGGGDPMHGYRSAEPGGKRPELGQGGRELVRILGAAKAAGKKTSVRTRDARAAVQAYADGNSRLVDTWKFSAPVGRSRVIAEALACYPGSLVSIVVGSGDDPERARAAAEFYLEGGGEVELQGDYNDRLLDNEAMARLAASLGAAYSPNYFTDPDVGKAFLVGREVRDGNALDPASAVRIL